MIYGYCRVSTRGQLKEGHSLEVQRQEILGRYNNAHIEYEQFTGTTIERPIFNKIIEELKQGDTLVVTKLDRMARNTVEGIQIVQKLFNKGVAVHVLNVGLLENTSMGKFFLTTLLAIAEMERNTIIERTQTGKAIAKQRPDFVEGRPKLYGGKQIDHALGLLDNMSYKQVEELTGISKSTLIRANNKRKATIMRAAS
jgi:DNA invertase Pin-like site-specific DNA recombinase